MFAKSEKLRWFILSVMDYVIIYHTWLHLGFSAKLGIWQVPACKMEPRNLTLLQNHLIWLKIAQNGSKSSNVLKSFKIILFWGFEPKDLP